jgi:class 3 adenylate cyclase
MEYTTEIRGLDSTSSESGHWHPVSVFSDPVLQELMPLLTYSLPLTFDATTGNCTSSISIDTSITWLSAQLQSMATRGNELYIVDARSMRLVGSSLSEADLPGANTVDEVPWTIPDTPNAHANAVLSRVISEYNGDLAGSTSELILTNVDKYIIAATHVTQGDLHWMVISRTPRSYYFGAAQTVFNVSIAVAVIVGVISAGSFIALHFAVTRPISKMLEMMLSISKLQEASVTRETPILQELQPLHQELNRLEVAVQSFARYVPRDVVRDLISSNELCQLQMIPMHCSMMFMDIRGFTTISERVPISQLNAIVQNYFELMSTIILDHDGVIDKYIGDCIMAVWGVPLAVHEASAKCALASVRLAREVNVDPLRSAFDDVGEQLAVRIGAASGEVLAGNMGCLFRMNYTVIGDHVNLAARLEALNKKFGSVILCDGNTLHGAARRLFCTRFLGRISVMGKSEAEKVYEIIGLAPPTSRAQRAVIDGATQAVSDGASSCDSDSDDDDVCVTHLAPTQSKFIIDVPIDAMGARSGTFGALGPRPQSRGITLGLAGTFSDASSHNLGGGASGGPSPSRVDGGANVCAVSEGSGYGVTPPAIVNALPPQGVVTSDLRGALNISHATASYNRGVGAQGSLAYGTSGAFGDTERGGDSTSVLATSMATTNGGAMDPELAAATTAFRQLVGQALLCNGCVATVEQQQYARAFEGASRALARGLTDRAIKLLEQLPHRYHPPHHPSAVLPQEDGARTYLMDFARAVQSDPVRAAAFDGMLVQTEK